MISFERFADSVSLWWLETTDQWTGRAPKGAKRSPEWRSVANAHLEAHPVCACCGGKVQLRVHHIRPFHLKPELELDRTNLITLCEAGKYGINCHLLLGHLGNWRRWNPAVVIDAYLWRAKLSGEIENRVAGLATKTDQ